MRILFLLSIHILLIISLHPIFLYAADTTTTSYVPLEPIPGLINTDGTTDFKTYFTNLPLVLIAVAAFLSVVFIILGGIQYLSTDAWTNKEAGKERVRNAVYGLLLAIASYAILNTINPQLLNLNLSLTSNKLVVQDTGSFKVKPPTKPEDNYNHCFTVKGLPIDENNQRMTTTLQPFFLCSSSDNLTRVAKTPFNRGKEICEALRSGALKNQRSEQLKVLVEQGTLSEADNTSLAPDVVQKFNKVQMYYFSRYDLGTVKPFKVLIYQVTSECTDSSILKPAVKQEQFDLEWKDGRWYN